LKKIFILISLIFTKACMIGSISESTFNYDDILSGDIVFSENIVEVESTVIFELKNIKNKSEALLGKANINKFEWNINCKEQQKEISKAPILRYKVQEIGTYTLCVVVEYSFAAAPNKFWKTILSNKDQTLQVTRKKYPAMLEYSNIDSNNFGKVMLAYSSYRTIHLKNIGEKIATFTANAFNNSFFSYTGNAFPGLNGTCNLILEPEATCTIELKYTPMDIELNETILSINYFDAERNTTFEIPLYGEGKGIIGTQDDYCVNYEGDLICINMVFIPDGIKYPSYNDNNIKTLEKSYAVADTTVTYKLWYIVRQWAEDSARGDKKYTFYNKGLAGSSGSVGLAPTAEEESLPVSFISLVDAMVFTNALTEWYNEYKNPSLANLSLVYFSDENYLTPIRISTLASNINPGGVNNPFIDPTANGFRLLYEDEIILAFKYRGAEKPTIGSLANDIIEVDSNGLTLYYSPRAYGSGANYTDFNNYELNEVAVVYNTFNCKNNLCKTSNFASKQANQLGLYDMTGNLEEFTNDNNSFNNVKITKGASFVSKEDMCLVSLNSSTVPNQKKYNTGLRLFKNFNSTNTTGSVFSFVAPNNNFNMVFVESGLSYPKGIHDNEIATVDTSYLIAKTELTYNVWYHVREWAESEERGANKYTFANPGCQGAILNNNVYSCLNPIGAEPSSQADLINQPVLNITWRDAIVFTNALTEWYNFHNGTNFDLVYYSDENFENPIRVSNNEKIIYNIPNKPSSGFTLGTQDNPYIKTSALGFRLGYANEWELAARYIGSELPDYENLYSEAVELNSIYWTPGLYASGASKGIYNDEIYEIAWFKYNSYYVSPSGDKYYSINHIKPVAQKRPNFLMLYDMSGNISEFLMSNYVSHGSLRIESSYESETSKYNIFNVARACATFGHCNDPELLGFRLGKSYK